MLSTVNPSDPSCSSSKVSGLRADERNSEKHTLQGSGQVGFGEAKTPNFSIREYVFASRNKNIGTSWTFPCQLLKLCMKHEIRDLLPPFEPLSSVRAHCRGGPVAETEKLPANSPQVSEIVQVIENPSEDVVLRCSDKTKGRCRSEEDKLENLINDEWEIGATSHNDIEKISARLVEPVVKCKLIQKPGVIYHTSGAEEVASTSMASDLMASKVCPVCKAFSSTSNTTLNAHMDQCLSVEYSNSTILVVDKIPKLNVKPRKKRLMEDIYVTAPLCSLEDLDRRNGTSWVKDLTFVAPITEANTEANTEDKRLRLSQIDTRGEKSEGPVYVDSHGIKLRILSKFNDAPQVISGEEYRYQNNIKGAEDEKRMLISKKKSSEAKYSEKMRLKLKNQKLGSLKLFKNVAAPEVAHHNESHHAEGSSVQLAGKQDQAAAGSGSATLRRWPCSKRSDLPRKVSKSGLHKSLEHRNLVTQISIMETRKSASVISCAAKSHLVKFSRSSESKVADLPANTLQHEDNWEKSSQGWSSKCDSTNVLLLKLSRASGALVSSPRSRKEELCMEIKQKLHDSPEAYKRSAETCHFPLKTKRVSTLSKLNSSTKMLRKTRSSVLTDKGKILFSFNSNAEQQRFEEAAVLGLPLEEVTDQSLHAGSNQCQDEPRNSEMKIQNMGLITPLETSLEKADCSLIIAKSVNSEDKGFMCDSNDKAKVIMPMEQEFSDKKDDQTPDKLEHGEEESQAEATFEQESSACLTSHEDLGHDIARGSTIITSASLPKEMDLAISRETSESPASSASTIFAALPKDSYSRASDSEPVSKHSTVRGKLCLPLPYTVEKEGTQKIDIERNQQVQMSSVKRSQHLSEYQPCCCSLRSIIAGTMPTWMSKPFQNLYIKPSNSSFDAYTSLWTANTTSVKSPTESILTITCSDVGSTSPSCGTPKQYSNSILRLMGKNLMVMHNEEPTQLPNVLSPASDNKSVQGLPSPFSYKSSFAVHSPAPSMTNMQIYNCLPSVQKSNMNHRAYATKEVIDGFSGDDIMLRGALSSVSASQNMFQRPFTCFPPKNQFLPRDNSLRSSCPIKKGSSLEVPDPLLRSTFVFRSP